MTTITPQDPKLLFSFHHCTTQNTPKSLLKTTWKPPKTHPKHHKKIHPLTTPNKHRPNQNKSSKNSQENQPISPKIPLFFHPYFSGATSTTTIMSSNKTPMLYWPYGFLSASFSFHTELANLSAIKNERMTLPTKNLFSL